MTDGGIKRDIGSHKTGFWDLSNPIQAKQTPLAEGLSIDKALEKARQTDGAELVVVNRDGKASVHSLSVKDRFFSENKQILVSELDRDPAKKQDLSKTPLAIHDNIAQAFSGQGAFLVDDKNQVTYLGDDVDQTTAAVKLREAEKFLEQPTQDRVNTAYAIARDAGNERHVDKKIATQVLDQLHQDYRRSEPASQKIALLKSGETKTQLEGLVGELNSLSGQESNRVTSLQAQLQERTDQWQNGLKAPTQERDQALSAWNSANQRETQAVTTAAYNLREARMPGVHQLEKNLGEAQSHSNQMRSRLNTAVEQRTQAQTQLNELERLPASAEKHRQQAEQLTGQNRELLMQAQTYAVNALSSVRSNLRGLERDLQHASSELNRERDKPRAPSGGGNSDSPYGKDPFAGDGNHVDSDSPYGKDPFAGGGNNSDPYGKDPFAGGGGQYRDENREESLRRQVVRLRSEQDDLLSRESGLQKVTQRLSVASDLNQVTFSFYSLNTVDRTALNQYQTRQQTNDRQIQTHKQTATNEQNRYQREIGGAQRNLANATSQEESARSRFGQAETQVANLEGNLRELTQNPRPDSHPDVKPRATAYERAVTHKEATVGADAPLTRKRDQTQARVDSLNQDYRSDKQQFESQISNVQQSLRSDAQAKIGQTRNQLVK